MTSRLSAVPALLLLLLLWSAMVPRPASAESLVANSPRERVNIDRGWRFAYGHADDPARDFDHGLRPFFFAKAGYGDGPANPAFGDGAWRLLDIPHDWAVELPFDPRGTTSHGSKAIGHAFPENSVGWYRKSIDIPASDRGRRISLEFDGVYRNSALWVNGHYIGTEPSGYSGFRYDITDYVKFGDRNIVALRVDATVEEGWFYEGAGIYRHVWLTKTDPLHVAQWGTFVRPVVMGDGATIEIDVSVINQAKTDARFSIIHEVIGVDDRTLAAGGRDELFLQGASSGDFSASVMLDKVQLWSLKDPHLYRLRTTLKRDGSIVDSYETKFGVRTVVWDRAKGFFLNGENIKLQGTNNHQDHAGVGVALPDGLQTWRLKQLKSIGVNAYRTSHHPPTPELLDEADRLGMLVIDEHRMMGTTPEIRGQLERLIRRDRNHPSVVLWSLGNEEWALEWEALGTHLASEMHDIVTRLDPTRRTSVAASGSGKGVSLAADVIGFNYGAQHDVDAFHRDHPEKPAVMSEEGSTLTTRGVYIDDREHVHLNAYDRQGRPGLSLSIEEGWRRVVQRPWMAGMFIWTGFDYRGEPTPFGWPAVSSQFGMLDTTGALKDTAYYLKSVWTKEPVIHLLPHWNWRGREGEAIDVRAYSNAEEVELLLNGKSLGRQQMVKDSHLRWSVPFAAGTLSARGFSGGRLVSSTDVETTGAPDRIRLKADVERLRANRPDVAVIWVNVTDSAGRIVPDAQNKVRFDVSGPIRIIGMGNGDPGSHEADRPAERHDFAPLGNWRSLAVTSFDDVAVTGRHEDTSNWRDPFKWLPPEAQPPLTEALVLRGTFGRPSVPEGGRASIFVDELHRDQKIYLNGAEVTPKRIDGALVLDIDGASLTDVNSLTYVFATPEGGVPALADRSVNGSRWGLIRITRPAARWERSVFNGWAQLIVQVSGKPGLGRVTASSDGLRPATVRIAVDQ